MGTKDLADAIRAGICTVDMASVQDSSTAMHGSYGLTTGPWAINRDNGLIDPKVFEDMLVKRGYGEKLKGKLVIKRTLKYKGITFIVNLGDEAMEFFEDPKNITKEELQVLNVTFPEYYKQIEDSWTTAYIKVQAKKVFESD